MDLCVNVSILFCGVIYNSPRWLIECFRFCNMRLEEFYNMKRSTDLFFFFFFLSVTTHLGLPDRVSRAALQGSPSVILWSASSCQFKGHRGAECLISYNLNTSSSVLEKKEEEEEDEEEEEEEETTSAFPSQSIIHWCSSSPGSSASSSSSAGSGTRFWPVAPLDLRVPPPPGAGPGSGTCCRGTPSPAPGSGAWCRDTASYGSTWRGSSWLRGLLQGGGGQRCSYKIHTCRGVCVCVCF